VFREWVGKILTLGRVEADRRKHDALKKKRVHVKRDRVSKDLKTGAGKDHPGESRVTGRRGRMALDGLVLTNRRGRSGE